MLFLLLRPVMQNAAESKSDLAWLGLHTIRTPQLEQIIDINRSRELSKLISNAFSQKIIDDDDDGNDEDDYAQC